MYLMTLIYLLLMTSDIEHLYMGFFALPMSYFLVKCLFKSSADFLLFIYF